VPLRLIHRIIQFRDGEAPVAWLMFAYSFLAMTAHNVLKPISKSKFILSFGADNLPYINLIAGAIIGVLMLLYTWGIARLPRRSIIPVTLGMLAALIVIFWVLFRLDAEWVSAAFFVFSVMLGILLISQFWTLANQIYDPRQARRVFGFIGGGASLGGALGAGITRWTVAHVALNNLLLVSAVSLAICVAIVAVVVRRQPEEPGDAPLPGVEEGVGIGEALRLLGQSQHLQIISLVIASAALGAAIIDQQLSMAAAAMKDTDAGLTSFLAEITFYLSLVSFVVQVGLTSRIHRSLGLTFALLVLPMGLGVAAAAVLMTGALWATSVAKVLDSSLRYSLDKTTREVLFLPLPPDLKLRAKAFIDVTMDRIAKAAGNLLALVLIKPWGLGLDWVRLSYASLTIMALWVGVAIIARREYLRSFRRSLDARDIEPEAVRITVADPATIATLVGELASTDESAVLYAIAMLETLDRRHLVTPLLLHHESPAVRARALAAMASAVTAEGAERWIPAVRQLVTDEDAGVRAAAVRALAALGDEDISALLTRHLHDADPRVVVTAAVELADSGRPEDAAAAERALSRLIADTEGPAAGRRDAAQALARIRNPACRTLLIPLLHDRDLDVASAAIASAQAMGASDAIFVPALVSRLGHRVLKRPAREALVSYGAEVVPALAHLLADPHEQPWVRRHIPGTLARIPVQASMDALFAVLADPDGFMRYKIVTAIEALHCSSPALTIRPEAVERLVVRESARYYTYLTLRYNLLQADQAGAQSLVVRALDDKLSRTLDRLYRELGLLYPWQDVAAARRTIETGDAHARASALEFLDTLLAGAIRKRVMPILDEMPMVDKVRHANNVLKTRPRDLDDTLAQLVHDDDPVLAAAAIELAARREVDSLVDDLEYVMARGTADGLVLDAANWALAGCAARRATGRRQVLGPLPIVRLADRLREMPLFAHISVDELFRVATTARQVAHDPGRNLAQQGAPATDVFLLIEGTVSLTGDSQPTDTAAAPAALGLEEALDNRRLRRTITAVEPVICLALAVGDLLTMLSDNIAMAQGLFRTLLAGHGTSAADALTMARGAHPAAAPAVPMNLVDKARLLRQNPLLGKASVEQLLALSAVTREVALAVGAVLPDDREGPAVYHLLDGEVRLEYDGDGSLVMGPGRTVFVAETLAGATPRYRATVTREGHALRLDHDELFEVLADHTDLLQGVFSGILGARLS
jgi:ATP/ADP translocase/HEAT repeat protein/CRP-like cAMP-binding protein